MITEIATFELSAPADFSNTTCPTASIIREFLASTKTVGGAKSAYVGQTNEKPETILMFIDWDSSDAHKQFMATAEYATILAPLKSVMNTSVPPRLLHVPAIPHSVLGQHPDVYVSEVVFFFFPASLTEEDIAGIMASVDKLRPTLERSESLGLFDGWAEEVDIVNPNPDLGGEKSRMWVNVVGWKDVAAHMRMQASEDFAANAHHLMGITSIRGMEMYHTELIKL